MNRKEFLARLSAGPVAALGGINLLGSKKLPANFRRGTTETDLQHDKSLPNIVFIMVDDLGYRELGSFGSRQFHTPNIDKITREGMKFTQAYAGCTVCAPSRCSLMTGFNTAHCTIRGNTGGIPIRESDVCFTQVLKKAGYTSGGFGKWGIGGAESEGSPMLHGFDEFFGYYDQIEAHDYYPSYLWKNDRKVKLPGKKGDPGSYSQYLIFDEMKRFIREQKNQPFFCFGSWTPPHFNYVIPDSDPALDFYKDKPWNQSQKNYGAMISMIDRQFGEIIDLISELGIERNTLVLFTSDNGGSDKMKALHPNGNLRGYKLDLYEGGIRVPAIAYWPGKIEAGKTSNLPWYFPDIMPTFAQLTGTEQYLPRHLDGISVVPELLNEGHQKRHDFMYWENPGYDWTRHVYITNGLRQAVRYGDWKLLRNGNDKPWELYNLATDVEEQHDISRDHPDVVQILSEWIANNRTEPVSQYDPLLQGYLNR